MTPRVSVVIPTHNRASYLIKAINSVFAQTYTDYEIVVVDDGSADNTKGALSELIDAKKIRYVHQEASGVSVARNHGVELARGELIAFLDSDDLFLPTKLDKQVALFSRQPELGFVHCSFAKFDDAGHALGVRDTSKFQGWVYPQMLLEWSTLMAMPCMLMRKEAFVNAGGFDESMHWAEDLDLWRRIARLYPIGAVPEVLVWVRVHPASATFEKRGGAQGFEYYLKKAFREDPGLSDDLKGKATAKMWAKLAQNLLGDGTTEDMQLVREYSQRALAEGLFEFGAMLAWVMSWLPKGLRNVLAQGVRRARYREI